MSFDLLATILFILLFVVGPLLQRRQQRRRPPPGPGTPDGRTAGAPPPQTRTEGDDPLSRRLEEARRRVLEAMGEEPEREPRPQRSTAAPSQPSSARVDRPELNWQQVVKPETSFIERRPAKSTLRSESGQAISAPPLRTERRRKAQRTAKLSVGRGFGTNGSAILNGIIWHEILSEPVSKRGHRRVQSRLRSR